jgi:hypothetical protein
MNRDIITIPALSLRLLTIEAIVDAIEDGLELPEKLQKT